jgi:RNA recognition motif-containing protein
MNIYVGDLAWKVEESDLKEAFEAFGKVASATIIKDKFTGKSRGFGFVVMPDKSESEAALAGMNGGDLDGRKLKANEARPRPQ